MDFRSNRLAYLSVFSISPLEWDLADHARKAKKTMMSQPRRLEGFPCDNEK